MRQISLKQLLFAMVWLAALSLVVAGALREEFWAKAVLISLGLTLCVQVLAGLFYWVFVAVSAVTTRVDSKTAQTLGTPSPTQPPQTMEP